MINYILACITCSLLVWLLEMSRPMLKQMHYSFSDNIYNKMI